MHPSSDEERVLRAYFGDVRYERLHRLALQENVTRGQEKRGTVVVLHGIMGSELTAFDRRTRGTRIWVHLWHLALGHMRYLRLNDIGRAEFDDSRSISATGLIKRYYAEQRILQKHQVAPVKKQRRHINRKRYNRPVPGDRVQMDVTKVGPKTYQFTAIDDCTRLRVLRLYPNKTLSSSLAFLQEVIKALPFPIQRIHTDWGTEFFNYEFQEVLAENFIAAANRQVSPNQTS